MSCALFMERDTLSRQKIVEELDANFFVEAGAGSGKTTILVKRMVAMVEAGRDVRQICAITFTKAAAGEFYDRFQKELIRRSTAPTEADFKQIPGELSNPSDLTRQRCLDALNNIDLCFMGTIDSFCNMILTEHPAKAGIPSGAEILEDEDMPLYYKKAYSDIQKGVYGSELQQLCRQFRAFHDDPGDVFLRAIGTLMNLRNCQIQFDTGSTDADEVLKNEKAQLLPVLQVLLKNPHLKCDDAKTDGPAWDALRDYENVLFSPWADNANRVLKALMAIRAIRLIPTDMSIFGPASSTFFQPRTRGTKNIKIIGYKFSEDALTPAIEKLQDLQYRVSMAFLTDALQKIALTLKKTGKLNFFDYLLYLRNTLKEDAASGGTLIRHIYSRHKYFLIDEFQDTNPMQAEVFFYLTAKNIQVDWRKCVPHPGALFIVGDPKQSIYRFRGADVSAFLRIREMFTGEVGEVVSLTRNFRSTHRMRSWFNRTFRELLPDTTPLQSRFDPIPLEVPPAPDGTFEGVYSYRGSIARGAAPEEQEPAQVAKIIHRIVNNPAYEIIPKNEGRRKLMYRDIMLITASKNSIGKYIQIFLQENIPFRVEGKVLLGECPALVAVVQIFSAVANPNSRQHLFGALTCQRFGFDLNRLHRLKNEGYSFSLYAEHPEGEAVSEAMEQLKQLVHKSHRMSAAALFSAIVEELEIFRYVGAKDMQYVYFVLELLRSAEGSGEFSSAPQAADYLKSLITGNSEAERSISLTKDENCVHIANLHKVKGLEAPVVILANPKKFEPAVGHRVEQQDPAPKCWLFQISKKSGNATIPLLTCNSYPAERDLEKACQEAEGKRLLYVAATRAQKVLLVANAIKSDGTASDQNIWKFFVDRCDGDFFETLPAGTVTPPEAKDKASAGALYDSADNLIPGNTSGADSYRILRPSQIKLKGKTSGEDDFEDVEDETARTHTVRANAALIGTLVHSLMEAMVSSRNTASVQALAREIASEYEAEGDSYQKLLEDVGTTIQNGGFPQLTATPRDILTTLLTADEVYCEVPFCRKSGGEIWHGIMDVVYRTGDQWFILDYKTNADAHHLDVKYQAQLAAYVEAFRELTGHTATPLIYHIDV